MADSNVQEFHRTLLRIAHQCRHTLTREEIRSLDGLGEQNGYALANVGLVKLSASLRDGSRLPSWDEFKSAIEEATGKVSDETIAEDTASRVLAAITKHGRRWADEFWITKPTHDGFGEEWVIDYPALRAAQTATIGEVGLAVVEKMGGWFRVCEEGFLSSDFKVLRAQIKRLALSVLELARAGRLDSPLALPKSADTQKRIASTGLQKADFTKLIPEKK